MKKAYANFFTCTFYEGFLGKITDFRECSTIQGVGLYLIRNIDFTFADTKFISYNVVLQNYKNNMVYPSPE